jgi:16S rRNA (uracil1498-N3)-methyltransferase
LKLFYCPNISSNIIWLTEEDSRHCLKVLRLKKGDTINVTDGKGTLCDAEINDENLKACSVRINNTRQEYNRRSFKLNIAIAPTKIINRFEWFLEKCTEIGIDEITPLLCEHSERRSISYDRSEKIVIAAMKQSSIAYLPVINPVVDIKTILSTNNHQLSTNKFIAVCDEFEGKKHLKEVYQKNTDALVMIGPEGDFSKQEVNFAIENGFKPVSISNHRLRTETAGIVACSIINSINN